MKHSSTNKGNTMLIQLSQAELKDAVRLFVTNSLNMDLTDKTLNITFTATRGDAGVITNLDIQKVGAAAEIEIPGFTNASPETVATANTQVIEQPAAEAKETKAPAASKAKDKGTPAPVTTATLTPAAAPAEPEPAVAAASDVPEVAAAEQEPAAEVTEAKPQTTSLFG